MMYRIGFIILTVLAAALGLVIGTLNPSRVVVDLLWLQVEWPLGMVLVLALGVGLILGLLLAWLFTVLPLRLQLRRGPGRTPAGEGFTPPKA